MAKPENRALVGNAADASQVRDARRKEKDARLTQLEDLRSVLETPSGRRLLWRILAHCGTFSSTYAEGNRTYYNAGRQDVGHFVVAEILEAQPERFALMMQEANKEEGNA